MAFPAAPALSPVAMGDRAVRVAPSETAEESGVARFELQTTDSKPPHPGMTLQIVAAGVIELVHALKA